MSKSDQNVEQDVKMYADLVRKTCSRCKRNKLLTDYTKDFKGRNGLSAQCKVCQKERRDKTFKERQNLWRRYAGKNIEKLKRRDKEYNLKRKFGMTMEDYDKMLAAQKNGCAICGVEKSKNGKALAVDHCHQTGLIRGLLCNEHNTALGLFSENLEIMQKAIDYLKKNDKK